jgi:hypothetical protein
MLSWSEKKERVNYWPQILESTFGILIDAKRMDFHLELIKENPTDELFG